MAIVSIGELMDRAKTLEHALEQFYARLRDETENEGVRLLSAYLSNHRNHLCEALRNFPAQRIQRIRSVKLKYDPALAPRIDANLHEEITNNVDGSTLLNRAVTYDAALITLYKLVLDQPLSEEARQVIEALVRVEERDIVMLRKMQAMDYF